MADSIGLILVGILLILLGRSNYCGNLSSIHSYHRKRVSEEDRVPYGRLVGIGTMLCGSVLVLNGVLIALAVRFEVSGLEVLGGIAVAVGIVLGLALSFYAMIKYNHGIF